MNTFRIPLLRINLGNIKTMHACDGARSDLNNILLLDVNNILIEIVLIVN